jgi:hypothetical protein
MVVVQDEREVSDCNPPKLAGIVIRDDRAAQPALFSRSGSFVGSFRYCRPIRQSDTAPINSTILRNLRSHGCPFPGAMCQPNIAATARVGLVRPAVPGYRRSRHRRDRRPVRTRSARCGLFVATVRPSRTIDQDDVRRERHQFRRISANAVGITPARTDVDPHVAAVGPAQFLQSLCKRNEAGA